MSVVSFDLCLWFTAIFDRMCNLFNLLGRNYDLIIIPSDSLKASVIVLLKPCYYRQMEGGKHNEQN